MNRSYPIDGAKSALWYATATKAPETSPLLSEEQCDVAIVGAGLTGLNAALHLVTNGASVCVIDAEAVGFGASGRSGGQVNVGLNLGPAALRERFGDAQAQRWIDAVINTPAYVFGLIEKYGLNCDAVQKGWVQGAINQQHLQTQHALISDYDTCGHANPFSALDKNAMLEATGTEQYEGGIFCPSAGSIQPLSYTRELARVAMKNGAKIFSRSRVHTLRQENDSWRISTDKGSVSCNKVLLCTNGYTDGLINKLAKNIVPVRSILAATEPLSANMRQKILPNGITFVDKRRLILYLRYDRDGRLCVGDHGPMRDAFSERDFDALKTRICSVFPDLKSVRWDYHWGGRVAMTREAIPYMHEVYPGVIAGMGFNGRGVGMGSVMGKVLAEAALGKATDDLAIPFTTPRRYPLHAFHKTGVTVAVKWYELLDVLERRSKN